MQLTCVNPECKYNETGVCVEGIEPAKKCPKLEEGNSNFDQSIQPSEDSAPEKAGVDFVLLDKGNPLGDVEASNIIRQHGARLIACIGKSEVGKTTLLASIYEHLNYAPIGKYSFGSSQNILAFEQLCHTARLASGRDRAETPHTIRENRPQFYHVALSLEQKTRVDLLIGDRAGEEYADALGSAQSCRILYEVKRADSLLILVDAQRLCSLEHRHSAKRDAVNFVKAFRDEQLLSKNCRVGVVMTRFDLAIKEGEEAEGRARAEHAAILDSIRREIPDQCEIIGIVVAVRPENPNPGRVEFFHGLEELIEFISKPVIPSKHEYQVPKGERSFYRLRAQDES